MTEPHNPRILAAREGTHYGVKHGFHHLRGLPFGQPVSGHRADQIIFCQRRPPPSPAPGRAGFAPHWEEWPVAPSSGVMRSTA